MILSLASATPYICQDAQNSVAQSETSTSVRQAQHVLSQSLAVYMSGWMNMSVSCLSCHQLALSLNSFILRWRWRPVRRTWRQLSRGSRGYLKAWTGRWAPFIFLSLTHTQSPHIRSHWTTPALSDDAFLYCSPFLFSFSLYLELPPCSPSYFPPVSLFFSSFVLWFFSLPHLCPSITVCSFTGSQGALYPPDTMPSIHITSRDTDTNYLKGT